MKGNKKTVALTEEQYKELISTIQSGCSLFRPNDRIATALVLEANLGLRISDIVALHLSDIVKDGTRYRLDIVEQKTSKKRTFTVPVEILNYIREYADRHGLGKNDLLFPITTTAVQKHLRTVCEYLGMDGISTHSFRKFYATNIYKNNNYNMVLVQKLLQHSSPAVTQRYIGIGTKELEDAIQKNLNLL